MRTLLIVLGIIGVLALAGAGGCGIVQNDLEDSRRWREYQQQIEFEERYAVFLDAVKLGWMTLPLMVIMVAALVAGDAYRRRAEPLVRLTSDAVTVERAALRDNNGRLLLLQKDLAELRTMVAALAAANQQPHTANYAPRVSISGAGQQHIDQADATETAAAVTVPPFADLLARGRVGRGNPLVLGYDVTSGAELAGSWLDLYSTAVGGMSGTGKTTTQRFLACQTALQGAKFAIIDPHADAGDESLAATLRPLSSAFLCEPASDDKSIRETVRLVADMGRRRVQGKDDDTTPIILWADETTALLGRSSVGGELAELLERVAQEYRKRHIFVCASGQIWTAARTTSELRDSFASVVCHRMKRSQARMLLPTEEAEQAERLEIGRAILWRTSGVTAKVAIPLTTAQDVATVASRLATHRLPPMPPSSHFVAGVKPESMPGSSQSVAETVAEPERLHSAPARPEAALIRQMFLDGADLAKIVLELRGIRSNEGSKYQRALVEVQALLRQSL